MADDCDLGQTSYRKTTGKSREQRRGMLFFRGKGKVGRVDINKKSIGVNWEFEV